MKHGTTNATTDKGLNKVLKIDEAQIEDHTHCDRFSENHVFAMVLRDKRCFFASTDAKRT